MGRIICGVYHTHHDTQNILFKSKVSLLRKKKNKNKSYCPTSQWKDFLKLQDHRFNQPARMKLERAKEKEKKRTIKTDPETFGDWSPFNFKHVLCQPQDNNLPLRMLSNGKLKKRTIVPNKIRKCHEHVQMAYE